MNGWLTRGAGWQPFGRETEAGWQEDLNSQMLGYGSIGADSPAYFQRFGYSGPTDAWDDYTYETEQGPAKGTGDFSALDNWLQSQGYQFGFNPETRQGGLVNADGSLVDGSAFSRNFNGDLLWIPLLAAGAAYASGLGAGAGGAGGGGAAGGLGAAELSGMDLAADALLGSGNNLFTAAGSFGAPAAASGGLVDSAITGGAEFNPGGITNPSFGTGADFAAVSPMNGGGMDWSSLLSSPQLWGNLLNAGVGIWGANKSAGVMADAGRDANALQKYMYDTARADFAPYRQAGVSALGQIQGLLDDPSSITNLPDYQFGLNQGLNALNSGAAARGMSQSGAADKARIRYGQDYAGSKLNESYNRLAGIAGIGQQATGSTTQAGVNYGNQVGNMLGQIGNARGSAYMGSANALGGAMGNALNTWQNQQLWNQFGGGWG